MALDDHRDGKAAIRTEEASLLRRERLMSHSGTSAVITFSTERSYHLQVR